MASFAGRELLFPRAGRVIRLAASALEAVRAGLVSRGAVVVPWGQTPPAAPGMGMPSHLVNPPGRPGVPAGAGGTPSLSWSGLAVIYQRVVRADSGRCAADDIARRGAIDRQ